MAPLTSECSGRRSAPPLIRALGCAKSYRGEACLRFDIYGRYQLEVIREGDSWKIYSLGVGTRAPVHSLVISPVQDDCPKEGPWTWQGDG